MMGAFATFSFPLATPEEKPSRPILIMATTKIPLFHAVLVLRVVEDEACAEVYAERKAEAARKKTEHEERVWYLNASDEERELHYFESTGLAEVEKHSEKVKALRAAIAEQKKERRDRITTKG